MLRQEDSNVPDAVSELIQLSVQQAVGEWQGAQEAQIQALQRNLDAQSAAVTALQSSQAQLHAGQQELHAVTVSQGLKFDALMAQMSQLVVALGARAPGDVEGPSQARDEEKGALAAPSEGANRRSRSPVRAAGPMAGC